ncbi:putative vesicle-associated membrane protein 726 [Camellia lanceoleosa]|uniref:Vesicle-associated membrane protein 726 n=1 Tax=Camellia lanceoleosa TaxID=1840588 RepID=A0ACC0ILU2_9ERIC|nr:putative vesicle-associated membrane protein 726 [Camellia lanceoleosa]
MGQQSLIYSFVAKGTVVLAEFIGNFTSIASQCLQKLPSIEFIAVFRALVMKLKEQLSEAEKEIHRLLERCDGVSSNSPASLFSMEAMDPPPFLGEFGMECELFVSGFMINSTYRRRTHLVQSFSVVFLYWFYYIS